MKSDVYVLESLESDYRFIPSEAEKVARYNDLDKKSALRLRLLAEEMICMLPQLLIYGKGKFWIENKGRDYELRLTVTPTDMNSADRDKIISVSSNKKNASAKGLIGKICNAVEVMVSDRAKLAKEDPYGYYMAGMMNNSETVSWSLMNYRQSFESESSREKDKEAWDELEKSIIGNLADDVLVGVLNGKVNITVKKSF